MSQPYTHGIWTVTPGHDEQFVNAWSELAEWTGREVPGSIWAKLLRDASAPNRFISFGPWESLDAIENWRALAGWQKRVQHLRGLLDEFQASTLELVADIE